MSSTKMSKSDFESKVLEELASIRAMLADAKSSPVASSSKEKKPRKPRDPDAPPNPWIVFTGKVRDALKNGGKPAGKQAQQFASYLKSEFPDAYSMDAEEILAAHADWTPPPAKPKEEDSEEKPAEEPKPKPKRTLSDEQKAKMAAGRKAAAERKKAEKEAAASHESQQEDEEEAAPVVVAKPQPTLKALPFKGKKYMWDPEGNGMWLQTPEGAKGAWVGTLAKDKKSIDNSSSDYTA